MSRRFRPPAFRWDDYESDAGLRVSSLAAQGMWLRLIWAAANTEPYGYLAVNEARIGPAEAARLCGIMEDEAARLLGELESNGAFARDRKGRLFAPILVERGPLSGSRPSIPAEIKEKVRARDGEACRYCGSTHGPFHFDHVKPWSRGGRHTVRNLALACAPCNLAKGNRTPKEMGWQRG